MADTRRTISSNITPEEAWDFIDNLIEYQPKDLAQIKRQFGKLNDKELKLLKERVSKLYTAIHGEIYYRSPKGKINALKQVLYKRHLTEQKRRGA